MAKRKKSKQARAAAEPDDAPGWHAIDAACERIYPTQKSPLHVASMPHPPIGDGLIYGISAYRAVKPKHWHFVTYGFSELYAKETDDPDVSGWGFELTFRLARGLERQPQNWTFNFLMNLGKYVRRSANPFGVGHVMDLNGPIALGTKTRIRAIAFTADPQLGTIDTPNGRVQFLQVAGLTMDEYAACGDWHTAAILAVMAEGNRLLITDLDRASILETPTLARRIQAGIDSEGSQSDRVFVSVIHWEAIGRGKTRTVTVTLGARAVQSLLPKLRSRLAHDREFALVGREQAVRFRMGKKASLNPGDPLTVTLTPAALTKVRAALRPVRGTYSWPQIPGLMMVVQPSELTDPDGKVIEVIG